MSVSQALPPRLPHERVFIAGWCRHDGAAYVVSSAVGTSLDAWADPTYWPQHCSPRCRRNAHVKARKARRRAGTPVCEESRCVAGCGRGRHGASRAGVPLPLCGSCLGAVERMCCGKVRYHHINGAIDGAYRMRDKTDRRLDPYRCPLCRQWHIGGGNREVRSWIGDVGHVAAEAVRRALMPAELKQLVRGWSPATAARPARVTSR